MTDQPNDGGDAAWRTPPLADVLRSVDGVDGWMSPDQAETLYDAARSCHRGDQIVEIGSFRGRSTIVLASAAPPGVAIVAIDPHAGNDRGPQEIDGFAAEAATDHEVFVSNLARAGVDRRVRHVRAMSHDAHDDVVGEITLLYIDGAHRFAPARQDIAEWGARVRAGGTLLIHDSFSSIGVTRAIVRELVFGTKFRYVGRARSMTIYHADLTGDRRSRAINAARQLAELPWFARNVLLKVLLTLKVGAVLRRFGRTEPEWPY
jgi:predicted O-methyltransferase YrrM